MNETAVNPVSWSLGMRFNQGELIAEQTRTRYVSGEIAMNSTERPEHDGDISDRLTPALDNLEAVLVRAEATRRKTPSRR